MAESVLTPTRIQNGMWHGILTGPTAQPALRVTLLGAEVSGVTVTPMADRPGSWQVQVPIPSETLNEGVQTFVIHNADTGVKLAHFAIVAGAAVDVDLRAEVDLLRAELDLLKRAFRRHCTETAPDHSAS